MPNSNCLEGIACPKCGAEDEFKVVVTTWMTMTDEGSGDFEHLQWEDASPIRCTTCDHEGTVAEFSGKPKPIPFGVDDGLYVDSKDRFVAVIASSYGPEHGVYSPAMAVGALMDLLTEPGCQDTTFVVRDRLTHETVWVELRDAEDPCGDSAPECHECGEPVEFIDGGWRHCEPSEDCAEAAVSPWDWDGV